MKKILYKEYLKSSAWGYLKNLVLKAAEHRCRLCNSDKRLQVHHRTYERIGHERIADLFVLCENCHGRFHDKILSSTSVMKIKEQLEKNNLLLSKEKKHNKIIILLKKNQALVAELLRHGKSAGKNSQRNFIRNI